jgi:hypothetical protein
MENFDLKKFLVENKMTTNSRMINEEEGTYDSDYAAAKQAVKR